MVQKIVSFGFRHGKPSAPQGSMVIDVRELLRNPFHDRRLRKLNGLHPDVQTDIRKTPSFDQMFAAWRDVATQLALPEIWIGCAGGHHRSVFVAHLLGEQLGVPVEHRDIEKP